MIAGKELAELRLIQSRVPRFYGVTWNEERKKYQSAIRVNGHIKILGFHDTPVGAFLRYKAERKPRRDKAEAAEQIEKMLALAARFPVQFTTERSLMGSSMDPTRDRLWRGDD